VGKSEACINSRRDVVCNVSSKGSSTPRFMIHPLMIHASSVDNVGRGRVANLQFNQLVIVAVGVNRVVKIVQQFGTVTGDKVDARDFTFL